MHSADGKQRVFASKYAVKKAENFWQMQNDEVNLIVM
jgi:hypothetical protein